MTKTFPPDWKIPIQFVWREVWLPVLIWRTQAGHLYDVFPEERRLNSFHSNLEMLSTCPLYIGHFSQKTLSNQKKVFFLVFFFTCMAGSRSLLYSPWIKHPYVSKLRLDARIRNMGKYLFWRSGSLTKVNSFSLWKYTFFLCECLQLVLSISQNTKSNVFTYESGF